MLRLERVLATCLAAGFAIAAPHVSTAGEELGLPAGIVAFLEEPWPVLEARELPAGFRPIVLSQIAEACADRAASSPAIREQARDCARRCAVLALDPRLAPAGLDPAHSMDLGQHGLYATHLLLVLGAASYLGTDEHDAIAHRLATQLAAAALADPLHHVPSFRGDAHRWPADQAATLHALWVHDQLHGTDLSVEPIRLWHEVMAASGTDGTLGLPRSELTGPEASTVPRGCALSWTVRHMAAFDRSRALELWQRYCAGYLVDMATLPLVRGSATPAAGLREWPPGVERSADIDSGPIVFGIGASASAFGIGAARAVGDEDSAARLEALAELGRAAAAAGFPGLGGSDSSILAQAITLQSSTVTDWFREEEHSVEGADH
jgi:hypothetical protein